MHRDPNRTNDATLNDELVGDHSDWLSRHYDGLEALEGLQALAEPLPPLRRR